MRRIYTGLWYAALPFLPVRLWWRGRREPGYRTAVAERFGRYGRYEPRPAGPLVWVHAVSLGETNAARPLIARIRAHHPGANVLLTHMTATGRAAGAAWGDPHVLQAWLPYDVPAFTRAFLRHFRPAVGLLLETEVWPNLIAAAQDAGVPLYLVNARLSERSAARYARIPRLAHAAFAGLAGVAAQTASDAERLARLGAASPVVTGSVKFDVPVPAGAEAAGAALRQRFGVTRPVLLAASTREGEEALILDAWSRRPPAAAAALLVVLPRHPQRFEAVARALTERGLAFVRRSDDRAVSGEASVVLGDTMGEMSAYCAAADVVLMGGSLLPFGGQNLIEPIAVGRPVLLGPHTFNFAAIAAMAIEAGAAWRVADADEAIARAGELFADPRRRATMQDAALRLHARERGATDRLWEWLAPRLARALQDGRAA